jgi:primosomal protein N' (replication factor Y)
VSSSVLIRIALPVPLPGGFDYLWEKTDTAPAIGVRVRVPFGRRVEVGVVTGHPQASSVRSDKLRSVLEVLDRDAVVRPELMKLLDWAAGYYHHPLGEVVAHALPTLLRKGRPIDGPQDVVWALTSGGRDAVANPSLERRAPRQFAALKLMLDQGRVAASELRAHGIAAAVLRRLADKRLCQPLAQSPPSQDGDRDVLDPAFSDAGPRLTHDQQSVVESIAGAQAGFSAHLVYGITGSGKTEVYLNLIRRELEAARQCLLLVPEIALTPQLVARLSERFGGRLAVLHSALSDRERLTAWARAHRGEARLVVGTRSAVFASLPRLGLIVVDEEHDASFKQQTGFRYSARDLAVVRARELGIPIVLGSATPSLESFHNARTGRYALHTLRQRIGTAGAPSYRIVDLNRHVETRNLSTPLLARIDEHLAEGNQILLFLNRRGFAPALFCPSCETASECTRCDARMTVHARVGRLRCHHCGREERLRWRCPVCGTERVGVGAGTQRVTEELEQLKPDTLIARLDRDVTARKGELDRVLAGVAAGETRILVGTQMLTKGHDFPNVTLVGVLNADQGLFGIDFRSNERLAQTIVQVAGRAGRADKPGEVVIQTHYPGHPLLRRLLESGYTAFAEAALAEREATGWPPFSHVAVLRAEATRRTAVFEFLAKARRYCSGSAVRILGPAADPMERKAGRYRAQLLLQCSERSPLHDSLSSLEGALRGWPETRKVRWSIDVDPVEL